MINPLNFDEDIVRDFVGEFLDAIDVGREYVVACIYKSSDFPDERQVHLVEVGDASFVLKLDLQSHETERLQKEYEVLLSLHSYYAPYEHLSVVEPIYISPRGNFFITRYAGEKTVQAAILASENRNQAGRLFRRAGEWLQALHLARPSRKEKFGSNWVFDEIESLLRAGGPKASETEFMPMIEMLYRDAARIRGAEEVRVFSHGDFHGRNLIVDSEKVYGLDFTSSREKFAVYDIVDFLKLDAFLDASSDEVGRSGISETNRSMFFKKYRTKIDRDVLDFALRARLLLDWLSVSERRYGATDFQRRKYHCLQERLAIAFDRPARKG